jgi:putative ATP-binding cassette transporter
MNLLKKFRSLPGFLARISALSLPYFRSEEKWRARALLAGIVALNLGIVYVLVLINDWNRVFYDALQNHDAKQFWEQLGRFSILAVIYIVTAVYKFYLTQLLELRWRGWMSAQYLDRWLAHKKFYLLELARFTAQAGESPPDNPDQRIQEDLKLFTSLTVSLSMGALNAVVTLLSFVGILWGLSGAFGFELQGQHYDIPGFMVWAAVVYALLGSVASHFIGRRLIPLNFGQQRLEADLRSHMGRVREYSESIALDGGEMVENGRIKLRLGAVLSNYLALVRAQKRLIWFTNFFGQAAVVFPFIVAAPRFFSGAIQLGELMQIASAFDKVQGALSWLVDNYDDLAGWRATTDRLTSFDDRLRLASSPSHSPLPNTDSRFELEHLSVQLPDGQALLQPTSLHAGAGSRVLLQGPSGSGKSTLFRAMAGLWPYTEGQVVLPERCSFIPQKPYLPNGSLREALAYPQAASAYSDADLRQALVQAQLPQLCDQLDHEDAWGQKLSGGEQQRLALARVMLKKPAWVFADEATSALDEATEQRLYSQLVNLVQTQGGGLVSIGHRPSLQAFHNMRWRLEQAEPGSRLFRVVPEPV